MRSKQAQEQIVKRALSLPTERDVQREIDEGEIVAVLIDSTVLGAEIWLALNEGFQADAGDKRAVFYASELPFFRVKTPNQLRAIHAVKVAFGGGKVRH